jgi:hypothetical protein
MRYITIFLLLIMFFTTDVMGLTVSSLPEKVQVVGIDDKRDVQKIIQKRPILLVVGSHDSLVIVNELPFAWLKRGWRIESRQFICVADVGNAPWPIKKWIIPGRLQDLKEERDEALQKYIPDIKNSPVILDFNGAFVKALGTDSLGKTGFAVYVIKSNGTVKEVYKSHINAHSGTEEAKTALIEKEALAVINAAHIDMGQKL